MLAVHLAGCASTGLPSQAELGAGAKAVVLLRVQCTIEGGRPYEPFGFSMVDDNVSFSLGSFETGGEPRQTGMLRFLSPESRRAGWTYLVLPHGMHYLVVSPPRRTDVFTFDAMMKRAPRFRIEVPAHAQLVYAGTLRIAGESDWLLTGGRIMKSIRGDETRIVNEQALARQLAAGYFPGLGDLQTVLMRHHEGPVILRSPLP
ncbi:MAG: hypothetical protein EHM17_01905 [Verrucomicrobiaceae bacterium]|nr:MAG: hypothetical protein EHM17_01905 [Verrucomicrobiaceae bacterium]